MILVTGATGQLGTNVIENLLKRLGADQIAALVRDETKAAALKEKGVNIRVGNYDDSASLEQAMQGIEKVLLIAGTDEEKRVQQHQNIIEAAKKAGVRCVAYTSRALKDRESLVNKLMEGHFQTEDRLIASGLNYIIFRNILYMDALLQLLGPNIFETGIRVPGGQGKVAYALRSDQAEGIPNALVDSDCNNRVYYFTGSAAYSFEEVAATLTRLSGRPVNYFPVEKAAFEAGMKQRGLPETVVERVSGFITDIKNGQEETVSADLENFLRRKPASLEEGLKVLFKL